LAGKEEAVNLIGGEADPAERDDSVGDGESVFDVLERLWEIVPIIVDVLIRCDVEPSERTDSVDAPRGREDGNIDERGDGGSLSTAFRGVGGKITESEPVDEDEGNGGKA
jgi:hypothetical protein